MADSVRPPGSLVRGLHGASLVLAGGTLLLGVVVIFGWHAGNRTLVQVLPQFVPMQYNTALGFVLCGLGLLLGHDCPRIRPRGRRSAPELRPLSALERRPAQAAGQERRHESQSGPGA